MDKTFDNSKPSDVIGHSKLGAFAAFYRENAEELAKITDSTLLDFCKNNDFDSKELKAFQRGLLSSFLFFNQCDAEVRALQAAQEQNPE